jgi:hypothetical protein
MEFQLWLCCLLLKHIHF